MRINHLIIGCDSIETARDFYVELLGFSFHDRFVDTGTGKEGFVLVLGKSEEVEVLLVPFGKERLPSPQHLAFETDETTFGSILNKALGKKLDVRALPPLDSKLKGVGTVAVRGKQYKRFYLLDPSRVNIEIMTSC